MHWHSAQCAESHNFLLSWHPIKKLTVLEQLLMPYQVPPPLRTDTEQVSKPNQWAEA